MNILNAYKKEMNDAGIKQEILIAIRNIHEKYDEIPEENLKFLNELIESLK